MPIINTGFRKQLPIEVIKRAKNGDVCAFEDIYHAYKDASYSLAYRLTYNTAVAEDITQEAYLKVFKSIVAYDMFMKSVNHTLLCRQNGTNIYNLLCSSQYKSQWQLEGQYM